MPEASRPDSTVRAPLAIKGAREGRRRPTQPARGSGVLGAGAAEREFRRGDDSHFQQWLNGVLTRCRIRISTENAGS
jgi:hypothetical protein